MRKTVFLVRLSGLFLRFGKPDPARVLMQWSRVVTLVVLLVAQTARAAGPGSDAEMIPDTPAGRVFSAFLVAYNQGSRASIARFVTDHYAPGKDVEAKTDDWLELYYKYGPVQVHGPSIAKDRDLEMWLYGTVTRAWFAVELILDKETGYIRAVGILQGEKPPDAPAIAVAVADLPEHINRYLSALDTAGYFAGTVLVARKGQLIYEGAFGLADQRRGIPMRVDTRLQLASITKVFTAVAVAQLVEQGKLSFDDSIGTYLPEYPKEIGEHVTIHQLLTHTSGIELDEIPDFNESKRNAESSDALLDAHLRHVDSLRTGGVFELPTKYDYSNEGYDLAGFIVERVTGQGFLEYITEHIFELAEMLDTGWFVVRPQQENVAIGYTHYLDADTFSDQEVPNTYFLDQALFGSTGLYSTVGDLNRFVNAFFYQSLLLSPAMRDTVIAAQVRRNSTETYGYGFERATTGAGVLSIGHNGGMQGASAELRYFPASKYCVVVLASKRTIAITVSNYIRDCLPQD